MARNNIPCTPDKLKPRAYNYEGETPADHTVICSPEKAENYYKALAGEVLTDTSYLELPLEDVSGAVEILSVSGIQITPEEITTRIRQSYHPLISPDLDVQTSRKDFLTALQTFNALTDTEQRDPRLLSMCRTALINTWIHFDTAHTATMERVRSQVQTEIDSHTIMQKTRTEIENGIRYQELSDQLGGLLEPQDFLNAANTPAYQFVMKKTSETSDGGETNSWLSSLTQKAGKLLQKKSARAKE